MDDFLVLGNHMMIVYIFLENVLRRCEETNLVINWENCHFMVQEGVILGHRVSKKGVEIDKAKTEVIDKL